MPRFMPAVFLIATLALAPALRAEGPEEEWEPDRPDFGEGVGTVAVGHFIFEAGTTVTRLGEEKSLTIGEALLRAGLGSRVEARIGTGTFNRIDPGIQGESTRSGLSDLSVGVKWRMIDGERGSAKPAIALVVDQGLPIGGDEVTERAWETEAVLAFNWELSERWSVGANLLGGRPKDGSERFTQTAWSVTTETSLTEKTGAYVEVYGFNREEVGGSSTQYANTGITYRIAKDLQLDARVGAGFSDPHPNWFFGVGASVHF
jgi:hypothetical protein